MGHPVDSVDRMVEELYSQHFSRPNKWTMVILCNGKSNKPAARQIFDNFNILDIVSDEINFFLPGYHTMDNNRNLQTLDCNVYDIERRNRSMYADYHYDRPFEVILSRRLGSIIFNVAAFADFVKELSLKCNDYYYSGKSELILLPLKDGKPVFDGLMNFPLDPLCGETMISLDQFLLETLIILWQEKILNTISFFARLFYRDKTLEKITNLYYQAITRNAIERYANEIKMELDQDILRHMNWKEGDKFFFISYSSEDNLEAMALRSCLESEGHKVWIAPDGIPQGRDYISVIPASIRMCKRFILLLSKSSANSSWVRNEVSTAISCRSSVNVLLTKGYNFDDLSKNESIKFMLDGCQIRYRLEEILSNDRVYQSFLQD